MAVPKKRTGHSAQGKRRANWKATKPETTVCSNCGQPVLAHTVCTACGYYKGEPVRLKDKAEAVATVTKPATETKSEEIAVEVVEAPKKSTRKKSVKTEETVEAEVKETEIKAEETVEEVVEEPKAEEKTDESAEQNRNC